MSELSVHHVVHSPLNLRGLGSNFKRTEVPLLRQGLVFIAYKRRKKPEEKSTTKNFLLPRHTRQKYIVTFSGNCWFVAGAATLATSDKALFERVVPPDQDFDASYAGAFRFNFWWYGTWTEVIVDDYLPTDGRELIYCHNRERPDELWPPLLEKAYAKLRGCYEALDGGQMKDAMVDLTGGISEVISLEDKDKVNYELYDLLVCSFSMKSMLGASISRPVGSTESEVGMSNGLYMGHAYSITGFQQLKTSKSVVRLMRLRNPWGRGEWNGAWSDNSREMQSLPSDIRAEMDARSVDEGEFWMSFEDFVKNFQEIQLCHLQIDAMVEELRDNQNKQNWNVMVYHDEWIRGVTAGGRCNPPNERLYWSNPQFYLNLSKTDTVLSSRGECTIIISLMKKETDKNALIAIGFDVYRLRKPDLRPLNERRAPENTLDMAKTSGNYECYREVTKRMVLPPGHYVIIPSTYLPNEEAKFMLRIFTEKFANSSVMEEKPDMSPILSPKDFVYDLFNKIAGSDSMLDAAELQTFLSAVSEEGGQHVA
ncbi:hypothetical protein C0Q70_00875 [Pomacea canaliculata]|uniref:Calpain catalytic domain-containing protein n=1 Tax=Pomacea canaliculata TaxID=400727 RepID=A0A2T7PXW1_POMCA|nr:hypothetical protein C0Q70_00875 [Pomacea canaliculata]